jgi:hypothetical protein
MRSTGMGRCLKHIAAPALDKKNYAPFVSSLFINDFYMCLCLQAVERPGLRCLWDFLNTVKNNDLDRYQYVPTYRYRVLWTFT